MAERLDPEAVRAAEDVPALVADLERQLAAYLAACGVGLPPVGPGTIGVHHESRGE